MHNPVRADLSAVQEAQAVEQRADESKKRFVSYSESRRNTLTSVFHEVRVPLNTALLAVQMLDEEGVFEALGKDSAEMVHGLMGSLTMMEKVRQGVAS